MVDACASVPCPRTRILESFSAPLLGTLHKGGRDKLTIFTSPGISDLGAWLEQLVAESTGKEGNGLIPVDREHIGAPDVYGNDRVFVYLRLESAPDAKQDAACDALKRRASQSCELPCQTIYDLGQEFFRWEIATAVAGSMIGINAFNQPDVEASKIETRKLTDEYEKTGSLPPESPVLRGGRVKLFTDEKNAAALKQAAGKDATLVGYLRAHLESPARRRLLRGARLHSDERSARSRSCRRFVTPCATSGAWRPVLGFGPRFLHSTGQAYKGGPNSGVFLQITCDDAADLPVPGTEIYLRHR